MNEISKYNEKRKKYQERIDHIHSEDILEAKEEGTIHDTWQFEQLLLSYIRDGEVDKLEGLFHSFTQKDDYTVGILADDPLRQAKNILIGLTAIVGKTAGIPGGMAIEEAYRLIDIYTQECEKAKTIEEINMLQFNMVLDFAERVRKQKLPADMSTEVFNAIQYINTNTNRKISLDEIAHEVGISRSLLTRRFLKETGSTINDYITDVKINDAYRLLLYTGRSYSEIANILGFSSQSYFQTVFKKKTGTTPKKYRERNKEMRIDTISSNIQGTNI